ncbi:MAG: MscS Mechanosensitive ion channel [Frankiales bacterium]|nr:MscS Mechanosensitive ion channel [Frankiales bacterium]
MNSAAPEGARAVAPLSDLGMWSRTNGLQIVLIVLGALLLTRLVSWFGNRITASIDEKAQVSDALVRSEAAKHRHAVAQVLTWGGMVVIYCAATVLVLQRFDVPLSGFVAPATVAGVAIGFGAQRIVQDILAGFFLITERQYGFGDVVRLSVPGVATTITGTVEELTLRVTRIRSINGEVVITPNGQIAQVVNLSRDWARAVVDVPVPATADVNKVSAALREVGHAAFADESLRPLLLDEPSVMGVESIDVGQFNVRLVARTLPGKQFDVGRELRVRITIALARAGITVPASVDTSEPTAAE